MTSEKELISKTFYLTLVDGKTNEHPIKVLGDLYMDEEQKETPDLSNIRYAQGELYYLNKDYEAAIFKWERVENELKPWAIKNIADAHCELNLLALAEDYYKSVHTESLVLKTEIYLQLFSLYLRLGHEASAVHSIKKAVQINPDYSDVTEIARTYFEDRGDWDNAVELAVKEAVRTESPTWFKVMEGYVKQGHTQSLEPGYFSEVLITLYHTDLYRFESFASALWQSYKSGSLYFRWLKEFNNLLANMEPETSLECKELSSLYKETYLELTSGKYLINDFSYLIPNLLNNWLKISLGSDVINAAAAVLAWSELFPDDLESSTVSKAEARLSEAPRYRNNLEDVLELFESIRKWAKGEGMALEERLEWLVGQLLDSNHYHLLIAGASSGGKNDIMNALLNQERFDHQTGLDPATANESEAPAAGYEIDKPASGFNEYQTARHVMIPYRMPIAKLNGGGLDQMDLPIITDQRNDGSDVFEYLHFADSLLFILNADLSLSDAGFEMAVKIKEHMPNLPIHFVLYGVKGAVNKEEALGAVEKSVK
ncbi:MAG: tetratricopeptide repeat protein, partial [Tuberibacillus sp.]